MTSQEPYEEPAWLREERERQRAELAAVQARIDGDPQLSQMKSILLELGLAEKDFSEHVMLGAEIDQTFGVTLGADGMWDVFYTERGNKSPHARVSTLRGACYALVGMLGRGNLIEAVRTEWTRRG